MANKPEYVDLISEATRQHRRRAPRFAHRRQAGGREDLEAQPLATSDVQAVEAREPDAVEVGVVEGERLALGLTLRHGHITNNNGTDSASDASGRRGAGRNRSR